MGRKSTSIRVDAWSEPHGPVLEVDGNVVRACYPGDVWSSFPLRGRLLRELAFLVSLSVPVIAGDRRPRSRLGAPRGDRQYASWLDREIPGLAERQPGAFLGRRAFRRVRWSFAAERTLPADEPSQPTDPRRALLANSLGADSLTSLLIGREMGLEVSLAHYRELAVPESGRVTDDDLAACAAVTGRRTALVTSDLHEVCRPERYGGSTTVLAGVLMLPRLCLLMLPFVYHVGAGNLVVGCELDLAFEWRLWPCGLAHESWMQSPVGLSEVDGWIAQLTEGRVRVVTLLGSLHDIAKLRVLHGTDPELGRLARSCWRHPDGAAWCGWCWNCSQKYLHLVAQGVEPESCGFETSPFDREVARRRYVLFTGGRSPVDEVIRDQELLAFLEALRRGTSGWAMDRFDRRYRREAERRETELRSRYLEPDYDNPRTAPLRSAPLFEQAHAAARRLVAALPDALRDGPPRRVPTASSRDSCG